MDETLDDYKYLWEKKDLGWVLLRAPDVAGRFCVFNKLHNTVLLIESEEMHEAVCQSMIMSSCEILHDMPNGFRRATVQALPEPQ
jgi:hypothetical protein